MPKPRGGRHLGVEVRQRLGGLEGDHEAVALQGALAEGATLGHQQPLAINQELQGA